MNERTKNILTALAWSVAITLLCAIDTKVNTEDWPFTVRYADSWLQDTLFQKDVSVPGDIVIIGIDEKDLDAFGSYSKWDRSIMASALEVLASDPEKRPAVVAIDMLYSGTINEESDQRLADAAKELNNVITATQATYGARRTFGGVSVVIDNYAVVNYEEPYDALREVTTQGHINTMYDSDFIARHALLYVEPEGNRVYSMQFEAAWMYAQKKGFEIKAPPTDSLGRFYITYSAKPGGFYDGVDLEMLINGKVDPSYYAGKIVLIGPYTTGLQDAYNTPVDKGVMMYGVEYQANVIQCILDGNYKEEVPALIQLGILFLVCFASALFFNNRRLLFAVPVLLAGMAVSVGTTVFLFSAGYITHALWIPLGLIVMFVVNVARNYIRAAIAKQSVTRTFERYVAPNIVGEILKEGTDALHLGGKTVDIAVLFVDVRGFTTMSERLSPEVVVKILNRYLTMASACVDETNGTVDKFVGDAMMAFWGAPIEDKDPVYHAALTALGIVEGAKKISAELKEEIGEELNVGVGINYGPAVVGNMGSEKRMDYTAIGDTVNTSARLEANAPGGTVYISRSCADRLAGRMKFEPLDHPIKLKGKTDGFEILRLIGPVDGTEDKTDEGKDISDK
ncbi:MAG: adenylate/guanylate cyclase domain-containing protein [Saccharofermentans sp.]|nr:adenylate/guanylate cyclase domain-containing protein [Saccharofermentans sp.]